ncbi:hypothetical protein SALCHL_000015 [Streptomyces albus subsp. chlorinus]|uniref:hypothetical protein n=2 Tax=Streptomyces albus TaxID=1888 RepID=UPI003D0A2F00
MMDEPTAALDARTEHRTYTRLRALAEERATVFVTHRPANTRLADRIIRPRAHRPDEHLRRTHQPASHLDLLRDTQAAREPVTPPEPAGPDQQDWTSPAAPDTPLPAGLLQDFLKDPFQGGILIQEHTVPDFEVPPL